MGLGWNSERIVVLKRMWCKDGRTMTEIAEHFGDMTKNAVAGQIHRMGLKRATNKSPGAITKRSPTAVPPKVSPKASPEVSPRIAPNVIPIRPDIRPQAPAPVEPACLPVVETRIVANCTLMQLTSRSCRFPINDPPPFGEYRFCGQRKLEGLPYCAGHARLSYVPVEARKGR